MKVKKEQSTIYGAKIGSTIITSSTPGMYVLRTAHGSAMLSSKDIEDIILFKDKVETDIKANKSAES